VVDLGSGRFVKAMAPGNSFTCAVLDDDSVKCWGQNTQGQLGLGDPAHRGDGPAEMGDALPAVDLGSGRSAKAVGGGYLHACALLDDDSVKCWGGNSQGQLGLGDTTLRGTAQGQMGDDLLPVDLGPGRSAKALAVGSYHACALLDDDSVKCWGQNGQGQLGLGDAGNRGLQPGQMGGNLPPVNLGSGRSAKALAAGGYHTCALLDDDSVKCWGQNGYGQLGLGDTSWRGDGLNEMGDSLLPIDLGPGRSAKAIALGYYHTCALLDDDSIKCWGFNEYGQLGLGDPDNRGDAAGEMGDSLPAVALGSGRSAKALATGVYHTCALLDDDSVKCWGWNGYGQLGLGDGDIRGDESGEMGSSLQDIDLW